MNLNTTTHSAFSAVRRHPLRAVAICVPLLAASVIAGSSMASATPTPTLAVVAGAANAAPPADVQIVDNNLPKTGAVVKTAPVKILWNEDGCDHDYGTSNMCVPWTIPGATTEAKCSWLTAHGFVDLTVAGTNRQDLPVNAQGYVCAADT